jgi:hypothetical protein
LKIRLTPDQQSNNTTIQQLINHPIQASLFLLA